MKFLIAHKNDILLIFVLILAACIVWSYLFFTRKAGGEAVVTVDGAIVATLPLNEDAKVPILPGSGFDAWTDFCNTVEVSAGCVRVIEANCPDGICEKTGWIRYDGEMIVCLPHKLIVLVVGGASSNDAMAQ